MKIAVIGATGFVGRALVVEFINQHFDVIAIARETEKLNLNSKKLTKVAIDIMNIDELANVLKEVDAVVSAFNAGWQNPNLYEDFTKGAIAIEKAVEKSKVKRFIMIGGAGSLYLDDNKTQIVDTPEFPTFIYAGATAVRDYYKNYLSKNTVLDWSFFSPAIEMHQGTSGNRKGSYRLGEKNPVFDEFGKSILSVEDLALVIADELKNNRYIRKQFTAAY